MCITSFLSLTNLANIESLVTSEQVYGQSIYVLYLDILGLVQQKLYEVKEPHLFH